ncbi:glycine betaine ABC transporter substrate-binding protein [Pseudonocardia sp. RS11V-5]|uniref:glycine betaine ABC transporter substrate-binding protein n=1 Tax=Pseudonocardia terrae TaxID=2905831 RepID=UPI001E466F4B|nr:glycine betaine ABC transporter substrate-binding protein [Pseudonocardia terrae]MCE3552742.1 glycine betaine ABC transporter substrate-binding protein [Pseudonocardia terrae]
MPRSPRARRASLLAGLVALLITITACSGQTTTFSGGTKSSSNSGGGGNKKVSISVVAGWDEDVAASNLWKVLLEQHGYTVNMQELDIASTFTGVANGQIDLYFDAWLPQTHGVYWDRFQNQLEKVTTWQDGVNTLVVPDYVSDVNTIADVKTHAADLDNRIVGIEAGAGEMKAMREKIIPAYGLEGMTLVEGSSPAMLATLDSAIKQKQPVVVTLWQPHWAFSRYPLKVLQDPQGAWGPPDQMTIIATKGWSEANPEVAGWLKNFKITPEQLSSLMLKIQEAGKGQEETATKQWVADNQQVVDAWFKGTNS